MTFLLYSSSGAAWVLYPKTPKQTEELSYAVRIISSLPQERSWPEKKEPETGQEPVKTDEIKPEVIETPDPIEPPTPTEALFPSNPHVESATVLPPQAAPPVTKPTEPETPSPESAPQIETHCALAETPQAPRIDIHGMESNFWSTVHAATAGAVRYPVLACRRGMEGSVVVILTIDRDGAVVAIDKKTASAEVFLRAVRDAVDRAQPYPRPPPELPCPVVLELPVLFRLSDA